MAASHRRRRLMADSTNIAVTIRICAYQCDPERNPTGICFANCAATCPSFCSITRRSASPPSSPSPANSPYSQIAPPAHNHPQLSFPLKISLIFLVSTFIYTIYKFYTVWYRSRRHRTQPTPSPENEETLDNEALDHPIWYIRTDGLQQSVINAISIVKFNKGDGGVIVGSDCSVCLSEFEADENLKLLPNCKHAFHISCIDTWLRSHTNCPLCRAGIVNNTVDDPSPEQNTDNVGLSGETDSRISVMEGNNREEASGSYGLSIGETGEDDVHRNSECFLIEGQFLRRI